MVMKWISGGLVLKASLNERVTWNIPPEGVQNGYTFFVERSMSFVALKL